MDTAIQVIESDLTVSRDPALVLEEARKAAAALQEVIRGKAKPVMFGGEQYLEYEDWQTIGRFYGVTAKVVSTTQLDPADGPEDGYEARAVALQVSTGREVSAADAMCTRSEKNWAEKPMFQLRSMAQTRACAKALRNVLAWVVVLAGYKPTPAEELDQQPVPTRPATETASPLLPNFGKYPKAPMSTVPTEGLQEYLRGMQSKLKTPDKDRKDGGKWRAKDTEVYNQLTQELNARAKRSPVASTDEFDEHLSQEADLELLKSEEGTG